MIGDGSVKLKAIETAVYDVLVKRFNVYTRIVLKNVFYLPNIDVNLMSGIRHYLSDEYLVKETLFSNDNESIALINFKKTGFLLEIKGFQTSKFNFVIELYPSTNYNFLYSNNSKENEVIVEISIMPQSERDKYEFIEPSDIENQKSDFDTDSNEFKKNISKSLDSNIPKKLTSDRFIELVKSLEKFWNLTNEDRSNRSVKSQNKGLELSFFDIKYQKLLKLVHLWHSRLRHISFKLLKKTAKVSFNISNLDAVKEADFRCTICDQGKLIRRPRTDSIQDPLETLNILEGDIFKISPMPYNKKPIRLFIIDRKARYQ